MLDEQTQSQTSQDETAAAVEMPSEAQMPAVQPKKALPGNILQPDQLRAGQTVRVHERIKDISAKGEERERVQIFEGILLGVKGAGISRTFTIRKISEGVGVEKIYPVASPVIAKIELVKTAHVRRAKLSFLNNVRHPFKRKLKETYVEQK